MGWGCLGLLIRGTNVVSHMLRPSLRLFRGENVILGLGTHFILGGPLGLEQTDRPILRHSDLTGAEVQF